MTRNFVTMNELLTSDAIERLASDIEYLRSTCARDAPLAGLIGALKGAQLDQEAQMLEDICAAGWLDVTQRVSQIVSQLNE